MFSSIDGFRSVNVNVANGYIATFNTAAFKTGIPSSDGSNLYLGGSISTGNGDQLFTKLNNNRSASISIEKTLGNTTTNETDYISDVDSGGNIYLVGGGGSGNIGLTSKFNSTGTLVWQKNITNTLNMNLRGVATESTGANIYVMASGSYTISSQNIGLDGVTKYNSSGTILNQNRVSYFVAGSTVYSQNITDLTVDGTNLYISGDIPTSFDSNISYHNFGSVEKRYSNGVSAWSSGLYDVTNIGNVGFNKSVVDSSGNVFILGSTNFITYANDLIAKIYANGALAWQKIISNTAMESLAVDSTGNLYLAGSLNPDQANSLYVSLNSSTGNINWQNFIYSPTGNILMNDINYANNFLYVGGYFQSGANSGVAMKLPSDGSGSGTHGPFVISNGNITVGTSLLTATSVSFGSIATTYGNSTANLTVSNGSSTRKIIPL